MTSVRPVRPHPAYLPEIPEKCSRQESPPQHSHPRRRSVKVRRRAQQGRWQVGLQRFDPQVRPWPARSSSRRSTQDYTEAIRLNCRSYSLLLTQGWKSVHRAADSSSGGCAYGRHMGSSTVRQPPAPPPGTGRKLDELHLGLAAVFNLSSIWMQFSIPSTARYFWIDPWAGHSPLQMAR